MTQRTAEERGCADEALAAALMAGDPAAALAAWRRFRPMVLRMLRRRIASSDAVEDLAQEVFEYFFVGVPKLRDPRALRAFVVTLANRTVISELRRRQRMQRLHVDADAQDLGLIGDRADAFSRHSVWRLRRLLAGMKERERHVLLMCQVERCRVEEVAERLGVSAPTIRRALARARRRVALLSEVDPFLCERVLVRGRRRYQLKTICPRGRGEDSR